MARIKKEDGLSPDQRIKIAYQLLDEAEKMLPVKEETKECMQTSEKICGAWAQATKAYKYWRVTEDYRRIIKKLRKKYPQFAYEIDYAHSTARHIHSEGFYEGTFCPWEGTIRAVKRGVAIIEDIIRKRKANFTK